MVDVYDNLTYIFADDAIDGALHFPIETSLGSGHLCGDGTDRRQSESPGPAQSLCEVCTAGEEQVSSPCLSSVMCPTLQLSTSLDICCRASRIVAVGSKLSFLQCMQVHFFLAPNYCTAELPAKSHQSL